MEKFVPVVALKHKSAVGSFPRVLSVSFIYTVVQKIQLSGHTHDINFSVYVYLNLSYVRDTNLRHNIKSAPKFFNLE